MNLEQIIADYGYKPTDFSECQLETIQTAINNQLNISTIINPKVDEVVMNIVVNETISSPDKISMLPYLYPGVSFTQLRNIRDAVEKDNHILVKHYIKLFKRDDLSKMRKSLLVKLIKYGINYFDLLDVSISDEKVSEEVKLRLPSYKL